MWRTGETIAGKYRVTGLLGEGGMGAVYRAHHELLDQAVAVKVLREQTPDPASRERFLREGRATARLRSPHVVRVNDVGELPSGELFIVMECLSGEDLAAAIARAGALPVPAAVDVVLQACDALAEAHHAGFIHRDLKPANLFLAREHDRVVAKVLDFGISKSLKDDVALTSTGQSIGSPIYMAPEQVRATKDVGVETDVWALGAILHESLVATAPFEAGTYGEVFAKILEAPVPRLTALRPDVPPALASIVERCLAKDPRQRFSSCGELAAALAPFGSGAHQGCVARAVSFATAFGATVLSPSSGKLPIAPSSSRHVLQQGTQGSFASPAPAQKAPSRGLAVGVFVLALLAVGTMSAYAIMRPRQPHARAGVPSESAPPPPTVSLPAPMPPLPSTASAALDLPVPAVTVPPAPPVTSAASSAPRSYRTPVPGPSPAPLTDTSKTRD